MGSTQKRPLITMATKLRDIPEAWLQTIEPRIVRKGTCWLWTGSIDGDGEPVINYLNLETGKRNIRQCKRVIAELFWEISRRIHVIHHCGNLLCLNPSHFYVTKRHWRHEDRKAMIKGKKASIADYVRRNLAHDEEV